MKLILLLGLAATALAEAPKPGSLEHLDAQYGFRDLKFEQALPKDMTLIEDGGQTKFYTRKSDLLEHGGVKLKSIEYSFVKGKLAGVTLNVAEGGDPGVLFNALEAEYGPPKKSPTKAGKFYWFGKQVVVDYWSGGVGRGTVAMWCRSLQQVSFGG